MNAEEYMKWKRKMIGIKPTQNNIMIDKPDTPCVICGSDELVEIKSVNEYICRECIEKLPSIAGLETKRVIGVGDKCIICGKKRYNGYNITKMPVCLKCMYKRLGKQKGALKCDGSIIFY
jgi:hypothetical protein